MRRSWRSIGGWFVFGVGLDIADPSKIAKTAGAA
jgi:hypothetical protein